MNVNLSQVDLFGKLLDATALRQRVLGQNIANVNTPHYQRQEVAFEEQLRAALTEGTWSAQKLDGLQPEVRPTLGLTARSDGNNVDIDLEMGRLTKNELLYETYTQILSHKLSTMRSAITGQP